MKPALDTKTDRAGPLRRFARDPLVHFVALGGALFLAYAVLAPAAPNTAEAERRIVVDAATEALLSDTFESVWRRRPSATEMAGLIDSHIAQEILVREARALGLDRGDAVVRQRLVTKMTLLLEGGAAAVDPSETQLAAYREANWDTFAQPPRVAFAQIALEDRGAAEAVREALEAGTDPSLLGRASLLPTRMPLTAIGAVDAMFGPGFAGQLAPLPEGTWVGPVESAYGFHLVRVTARAPAELPPLAEQRDRVLSAWREAQGRAAREAAMAELRDRYIVERRARGDDE